MKPATRALPNRQHCITGHEDVNEVYVAFPCFYAKRRDRLWGMLVFQILASWRQAKWINVRPDGPLSPEVLQAVWQGYKTGQEAQQFHNEPHIGHSLSSWVPQLPPSFLTPP